MLGGYITPIFNVVENRFRLILLYMDAPVSISNI